MVLAPTPSPNPALVGLVTTRPHHTESDDAIASRVNALGPGSSFRRSQSGLSCLASALEALEGGGAAPHGVLLTFRPNRMCNQVRWSLSLTCVRLPTRVCLGWCSTVEWGFSCRL